MTPYSPPLRDITFVLRELAGLDEIAGLPGFEDATSDVVQSVLDEAGRIASQVLAPLNQTGDQQGIRRENGTVKTPDGWRQAYRTLTEGNWIGLSCPQEFGGMGLPGVVDAAVSEMWQAANMAFSLCPMLTQGAINAIRTCGDEALQAKYLPRLVSGEWAGTMNLSEAAAGSDLGAIRTKAVRKDGHYLVSGQKIFITYGDHDLTENIIHLVLARTPDAPVGVKGISLFAVPKMLIGDDGKTIRRNDVQCLSLEHKLGIHASPTAVLSFGEKEGAIGFLIGDENRGLEYMFVMMNHARLNVGLQGLAIAERAYQQARAYAQERIQGRPIGCSAPSAIVDHPDVRRMLMGMKAEIEAMRALAYLAAAALDRAQAHPLPAERDAAKRYAELLNPIVKGWCTERGFEIASTGVQIHGGTGYIESTGAAQHLRDARITTIYEGTTGIQANDLINRKILKDGGLTLDRSLDDAGKTARELAQHDDPILQDIGNALNRAVGDAHRASRWLQDVAAEDPRQAAAAGVPLLLLLGTVLGGHEMARAARLAVIRAAETDTDQGFYRTKLKTAWHYAEAILPRSSGLLGTIIRGSRTVMVLDREEL
ncbi:acyl-CoA dehydrogenase [Telmatospirillum siberiense]|uniref:3-methylmercaptopropionyl-CoA dehydrogenase n=1 Tax=Telmatospirillum siberiense TaxID=382514 RepID=A0A2N3PMI1_9PROT|nr:acyl-CoA dehydrogenase [Telmatospirillum siberiense]PKU21608.1 acyl-CoA dehydrogenase [Telmatospirillum siberiense]